MGWIWHVVRAAYRTLTHRTSCGVVVYSGRSGGSLSPFNVERRS